MKVCSDEIFWTAEQLTTKHGKVMHHHEPKYCEKVAFAFFKVKVTMNAHVIKIWFFVVSLELRILLQPNFGLMAHYHKLGFLVKRLHCCVVLKVKVTSTVQNFIEFSSGPYLLNCWTFRNDAKRLVSYLQGQCNSEGCKSNKTVSTLSINGWSPFAAEVIDKADIHCGLFQSTSS